MRQRNRTREFVQSLCGYTYRHRGKLHQREFNRQGGLYSRSLQQGRETELISRYNRGSWGFTANRQSRESEDGKVLGVTWLGIKGGGIPAELSLSGPGWGLVEKSAPD